MLKKSLLMFLLVTWAVQANAKEIIYQGKVEGMVCSFCVYGVSKKIGQLPEVDARTVNVDLKSGLVSFHSSSELSLEKVSKVFSGSGFKLVELKKVDQPTLKMAVYEKKPALVFNLNNTDIKKYGAILESIGDIASAETGKLEIKAPESLETELLKPMIGGKQKIARIQFDFDKSKKIQIKLFLRAE